MNDTAHTLQGFVQADTVPHVTADEAKIGRPTVHHTVVDLSDERVEHSDAVTTLNKFLDDISADKSAAACDKYRLHENGPERWLKVAPNRVRSGMFLRSRHLFHLCHHQ